MGIANKNAFYAENNEISWIIDYDGKQTKSYQPGATEHLNVSKKINIYIHPSALGNAQKLFVIMGHEYVHALDHDSGLFDNLYTQYRSQIIANNILEFRAYTWSAFAESQLGLGMGMAGQLERYTNLLPKDYLQK